MVGIAISTALGMVIASTRLISPSLLFFLTVFCLLMAFTFRRSSKSALLIYITVALVAACRFLVSQPGLSPDCINRATVPADHETGLSGQVSGFPEFYACDSGISGLWVFPLEIDSIQTSNGWKTASGEADVKISPASAQLGASYGDRIRISGTLERNIFPGRNVFSLKMRETDLEILEPSGKWSLVAWGRAWRNSVAPRLENGMENLAVQKAVLKALVLGFRKEIPVEVSDVFRRTGSMHIFAISGLHVGIVGLLLALALKTLGIPRDKFGLFLIPLLTLYVISTGMKSSALRALLMASVFMLAPLFRRKPDIPTSVSVAAIVLLFFQPLEILSAGFIFSFTVVIFLVMAFSTVPQTWIRGPWIKTYSASLLITSVAAGLASIPLAALFFGMFSPIALIGNLLVVPLTFCIVLCGWLSILLPVVSQVFNHAAVVFIDLLLGCVQKLDQLPGSSWPVEPPPLFSILLWYGSLIALMTYATLPKQRLAAIGGAVGAVLLAVLG